MLSDKPYTLDRLVRLALAAGLIWAVVAVLDRLSGVLIPFALAVLLAYMTYPLVRTVQRLVKARILAVALVMLGLSAILGLFLWLVIPLVAQEIKHTAQLVSAFLGDTEAAQRARSLLPDNLWLWLQETLGKEEVQNFFKTENLWKLVEASLKHVLPGVWDIFASALNLVLAVLGLGVVLLYFFFLLLDWERFQTDWRNLVPERYKGVVSDFLDDVESTMSRYFRGQSLVALCVGVLMSIGFTLIGLPLAILFGLTVGLMNMVPYLQNLALIPAALLATAQALESGSSVWLMLGLTGGVFLVVQVLQDTLIVPRIMKQALGLSPVVILLSLSIWGVLLGFLGVLIALPLTVLVTAWYRRLIKARLDKTDEAEAA